MKKITKVLICVLAVVMVLGLTSTAFAWWYPSDVDSMYDYHFILSANHNTYSLNNTIVTVYGYDECSSATSVHTSRMYVGTAQAMPSALDFSQFANFTGPLEGLTYSSWRGQTGHFNFKAGAYLSCEAYGEWGSKTNP